MEKLRKPYGSVLDLIFLFFLFPFTNRKWNMLTQDFQKVYGSITKALEVIFFSTKLGRWLPRLLPLEARKSPESSRWAQIWKFLFTPQLDKFAPIFVFFGCFLSKTSRNFTDSMAMGVKPFEAIKNDPRMKLGCNILFTLTLTLLNTLSFSCF